MSLQVVGDVLLWARFWCYYLLYASHSAAPVICESLRRSMVQWASKGVDDYQVWMFLLAAHP